MIFSDKDVAFDDDTGNTSGIWAGGPAGALDDVLTGMSIRDQNKIRRMMREKDEKIKTLSKEIEELHTKIEDLTADNSDMRIR